MTKAELIEMIENLSDEKYENIISFTVVGNYQDEKGDTLLISRHHVDDNYEDNYGNKAANIATNKTIEEAIYMAADLMDKDLNPEVVFKKAKYITNQLYLEMTD